MRNRKRKTFKIKNVERKYKCETKSANLEALAAAGFTIVGNYARSGQTLQPIMAQKGVGKTFFGGKSSPE